MIWIKQIWMNQQDVIWNYNNCFESQSIAKREFILLNWKQSSYFIHKCGASGITAK